MHLSPRPTPYPLQTQQMGAPKLELACAACAACARWARRRQRCGGSSARRRRPLLPWCRRPKHHHVPLRRQRLGGSRSGPERKRPPRDRALRRAPCRPGVLSCRRKRAAVLSSTAVCARVTSAKLEKDSRLPARRSQIKSIKLETFIWAWAGAGVRYVGTV